ncbi:MAG: YigZ family protein [Campylobacterota bacterium]
MKFVKDEFSEVFEEKKSKFIAHIVPFEQFDDLMKALKSKHTKARHFVYAYRFLNEKGQIVENSSDDGEPKGTSGKPCLNVLAGANIINSAVIVVRYFGGIKLGTGGLVRSYGASVNSVLKKCDFFEYKDNITSYINCDYSIFSKIEYILNQENIQIVSKDFTTSVKIKIKLTKQEFENLKEKLPLESKLYKV